MRISDWSSDVCSSDLNLPPLPFTLADILKHPGIKHPHPPLFERDHARFLPALELAVDMLAAHARPIAAFGLAQSDALRTSAERRVGQACRRPSRPRSSPEPQKQTPPTPIPPPP